MKNWRRHGFTVIEMTTSMVIMLIVTTALFMISNDSWKISRQLEIQGQAMEVNRLASETLNRNLTGASNVADFLPSAFNSGGYAGDAKGTASNHIYFAKPSAFDNLGEPVEYDLFLYYITNQTTLRTVGTKVERVYDLREYRVRRVLSGQLDAAFTPLATEASIQAGSPSAAFADRLVASGIDGESNSGTVQGFLVVSVVTHLAAAATAGGNSLSVVSVNNFTSGDTITVEGQAYLVSGVDAAPAPQIITTSQALRRNHAIDAPVTSMTDSVTVQIVSAVMGRSNEGISRVPVTTRIYLRNS